MSCPFPRHTPLGAPGPACWLRDHCPWGLWGLTNKGPISPWEGGVQQTPPQIFMFKRPNQAPGSPSFGDSALPRAAWSPPPPHRMSRSPGGWASRAASFAHCLLQRPHPPLQPQPWPPASVSPPTHTAPLAAATAPTPKQLHSLSGQCPSPGTHTRHSSSLPPGAGFLLQAPVRAAGAVASLLAAPCTTLGLPAAWAASCESAFSSLPAKVKPSPLAWPGFTSGLGSWHTATWLLGWGG